MVSSTIRYWARCSAGRPARRVGRGSDLDCPEWIVNCGVGEGRRVSMFRPGGCGAGDEIRLADATYVVPAVPAEGVLLQDVTGRIS
jgi:hypothetical protein